ncbi:hypothetical protein O1R50_23980 [Glycomyces luteolus]|uniref:Uncharacterized protein n=1 Tax=Glycomyces luteolus TaxID=2670330 RepID=A0A9X3PET5_9ACTN|nr:hypothetical protein [Glycomyces luteolus]MDA1362701.1 hypothetical protein [Glycomyces luteolus]
MEGARSGGSGQERGDGERPCGLPGDGDVVRVAAEGRDVVADPPQRGGLVLQAQVGAVVPVLATEIGQVRYPSGPSR